MDWWIGGLMDWWVQIANSFIQKSINPSIQLSNPARSAIVGDEVTSPLAISKWTPYVVPYNVRRGQFDNGATATNYDRMIRRDYILRMIEEFVQMLARLNAFKREGDWGHAEEEVDAEFEKLMGTDLGALARLSDTELLAKVAAGEPTQVVRHKTMMVATLLREAGDIAMAGERAEEGKRFYLQALNLLLDVEARGDVEEMPEFVPKIDVLASVLSGHELPLGTQAMLMQHYERIGEFGKAEDALFAMLDAQPDNSAIAEFGMGFYRRLLAKNDVALADGNLPREEVETAIKDLQGRFPATR